MGTEIHLSPSEIKLGNSKCFEAPIFEKKTIEAQVDPDTGLPGKPQTYNSAQLKYKHYNNKTKKYEEQGRWLVQGPPMKTRGGLVWEKKGKKWGAYILCTSLNPRDEGIAEFLGHPVEMSEWLKMPEISTTEETGRDSIGFMSNLHLRCMEFAFPMRKNLGMDSVKKIDSFDTVFKSPIKWQTDANGNIPEGASASAFWKVFVMGDPKKATTRKATFSVPDPDSKEGEYVLPWEYLESCEMTFVPLFHVKSIYAGGGKASLQMEIISAVVLDFIRLNTRGEQKDLIQKYNTDDQLTTKLADQLQQMKNLLGDSSGDKKKEDDTTKKGKGKPKKVDSDDSGDDTKKKGKGKPKKVDSDDSGDEKITKKGKSSSFPAPGKKMPPPVKKVDDDDESEDDIKEIKNVKKPAKKPSSDEDDSEDDVKESKKTTAPIKKNASTKKVDDEDVDDVPPKESKKDIKKIDDNDDDVPPKETKETKKPKQKVESENDDDDDSSKKTKSSSPAAKPPIAKKKDEAKPAKKKVEDDNDDLE